MNPIKIFDFKSKQLFWQAVDASHLSGVPAPRTIEPGQAYFTVRLCEMYLATARKLWRQIYPLLHCFADVGGAEQHIIIGPTQFSELGDTNLDRMANLRQQLCGPVPYLGQDVTILAGLYAAPGHDSAQALIDLVGSLTSIYPAGVLPYLPLAAVVKSGVDSILGLDQIALELGIRDTFNADNSPLTSGYWIGINAPGSTIDPSQFWIVNGRLMKGKDAASATLYSDHDYMVLGIERVEARADWRQVSEVAEGLSQFSVILSDAAFTVDEKRSRMAALWLPFIQALQNSPNLTVPDRERVAAMVSADLLNRLNAQQAANPFIQNAA